MQTTLAQIPETQLHDQVFVKGCHDLLCQMLHLNQVGLKYSKNGWTIACLKVAGTTPFARELLVIAVTTGLKAGKTSLKI